MKTSERRNKIMEMLYAGKSVSSEDLIPMFDVTGETIRKDLIALSKTGKVVRTHGGAIWNEGGAERPTNMKTAQNRREKKAIAKTAAQFVCDDDYIFIDSGTTVSHMLDYISEQKNLVIATNSLLLAEKIAKHENIQLLLSGGSYRRMGMSFAGAIAEEQVLRFYIPKAFISCEGIDLEYGIMDGNEDENRVKKQIFKTAKEIYLLADHTKFYARSYNFLNEVSAVTAIITDDGLPQEIIDEYTAKGIKIIVSPV